MAMQSRFAKGFIAAVCFGAAMANAQAPIIDASQPVSSSRGKSASAAPAATSAGSDMYMQLQSLQQEVMELRGIVEEQSHQIETLKQQGLDRYNDLDRRIGQSQSNTVSAPVSSPAADSAAGPRPAEAQPAPVAAPVAVAATMEAAKPEEYEAYQVAYTKLKGQDFPGAIKAFTAFNSAYPASPLTANANYWLGKAYLLQSPQDLNKAQLAFAKVGEHPQHTKAPDALYELGKIYFLKGDKVKAKALLQQVIDSYGASGSSAPQSAKLFLDQNFPAAKR